MKPIAIFTQYWGSYGELYHKYLLKSMLADNNLPRLKSEGYPITWYVVGDRPPTGYNPFMEYHPAAQNSLVYYIHDFFRDHKNEFIMVPCPDLFIGNGTVYNGIKILENKPNICLCVAHPRVSLESMNGIDIDAKTNAELVTFAFKYPHKCLWASNDQRPQNITWGALSWRQIDENNFAVVHNLASPFILQLTDSDVDLFIGHDLGWLDRFFNEKIQKESRVKVCGSSDLCFFIEITSDKHDPTIRDGLQYNDVSHYECEGMNYLHDTLILWRKG